VVCALNKKINYCFNYFDLKEEKKIFNISVPALLSLILAKWFGVILRSEDYIRLIF